MKPARTRVILVLLETLRQFKIWNRDSVKQSVRSTFRRTNVFTDL